MIKLIAAIDSKRGIATEQGIPWNLPADISYFRQMTENYPVLMGSGVYKEFQKPRGKRQNFVLSHHSGPLRPGFELVSDLKALLSSFSENDKVLWVIGGANIYEQTIDYANELYITQIEHDFKATKFFPSFHREFKLANNSQTQQQNKLTFRFEVWRRKK